MPVDPNFARALVVFIAVPVAIAVIRTDSKRDREAQCEPQKDHEHTGARKLLRGRSSRERVLRYVIDSTPTFPILYAAMKSILTGSGESP